jgi:hypothetical protein
MSGNNNCVPFACRIETPHLLTWPAKSTLIGLALCIDYPFHCAAFPPTIRKCLTVGKIICQDYRYQQRSTQQTIVFAYVIHGTRISLHHYCIHRRQNKSPFMKKILKMGNCNTAGPNDKRWMALL